MQNINSKIRSISQRKQFQNNIPGSTRGNSLEINCNQKHNPIQNYTNPSIIKQSEPNFIEQGLRQKNLDLRKKKLHMLDNQLSIETNYDNNNKQKENPVISNNKQSEWHNCFDSLSNNISLKKSLNKFAKEKTQEESTLDDYKKLQNDLREIAAKNNNLEINIASLRDENSKKLENIKILNSENIEYKSLLIKKCKELEDTNFEYEDNYTKLKKEYESICNENFLNKKKIRDLENLKKENSLQLNNEIIALTKEHQILQRGYTELKEDNQKFQELENEISNKFNQNILSIRKDHLQEIQILQEKINQLEIQVKEIGYDLEEKIKIKDQYKEEVDNLFSKNEQLSILTKDQEDELKVLQKKVKENENLQEQISELQAKKSSNEEIIYKQRQIIADIEEKNPNFSVDVNNLLFIKDNQLEELEKKLADTKKEFESAKVIYEERIKSLRYMHAENNSLNQALEKLNIKEDELNFKFEKEVSDLKNKMNEIQLKNNNISSEIYNKEVIILQIETEKSEFIYKIKELENEKKILSEKDEKLNKLYQNAIKNEEDNFIIKYLEDKNINARKTISQLEEINKNQKNIIHKNEQEIKILVSDCEILKEQFKKQEECMNHAIFELKQGLIEKEQEISILEKNFLVKDVEQKTVNNENNALKIEINQLGQNINALNMQIQTLNTSLETEKIKYESKLVEINVLNEKVINLQETIDSNQERGKIVSDEDHYRNEIDKLTNQISIYQKNNCELVDQFTAKNQQYDELKEEYKIEKERINKLNRELNYQLERMNECINNNINQKEIEKYITTIKILEDKNNSLTMILNKNEIEIKRILESTQNGDLIYRLSQMEEMNAKIIEENKKLKEKAEILILR